MSANIDAMLRAASDAVRANKKAEARELLEKVLELDEHNEQAWLWMSGVVDSAEDRRVCLENILIINPTNETALKGIRQLGEATSAASSAPRAAATTVLTTPSTPAFSLDNEDLFSDVSFEEPTQESTSAWSVGGDDPWATPSSASSTSGSSTFDNQIPDDWAASIVKKPTAGKAATSSSVFGDADEDTLFESRPASTSASQFNDPFGADPFAASDFAPDAFTNTNAFSEDDFDSYTTATAAPSRYAPAVADDFDSLTSQPIEEDFDDLFVDEAAPVPRAPRRATEEKSADELFAMIPGDIPVGRLPGVDDRLPGSVRVLFTIAIVLNIGAFGLLISRMIA